MLVKAATDSYTAVLRGITGKGAFNDLDFLVVGCATDGPCEPGTQRPLPPLTAIQQRTQFCTFARSCVSPSPQRCRSSVSTLLLTAAYARAARRCIRPHSTHPDATPPFNPTSLAAMWCILASPLIIGSDVRTLDAYALETLLNSDAVAISQDPLVARPFVAGGNFSSAQPSGAWARHMANGDVAVALLNLGDAPALLTVTLASLGIGSGGAKVFDVWTKATTECTAPVYSATVNAHQALLLRMTAL